MKEHAGGRLHVVGAIRRISSVATLGGLVAAIPLALVAAAGAAAADTVAAADADVAGPATLRPPAAEASSLQEIVVTAQKREQSINDVGMSITALSNDQVRELGITTVGDLTKVEPSFVYSNASSGTPVYSIRGVGYNERSLAASPAVSVYVDEVPFAYPSLTKGATLDLERVEVLKGPQGTLFGQNATGGAINYIAAKPTDHAESGYEFTYGRFGALDLNGFISGPITDTLRARLAFDTTQGGAWQRSTTTGAMLGNQDTVTARLLVDWQPSSDLRFALNINGWSNKSDALAPQFEKPTPQDTYLIPELAAYPAVQQRLINLVSEIVHYPVVLNDQAADWDQGTNPGPPLNDEHFYQTALRTEYSISDSMELTSITSYAHLNQNDELDSDGTTLDITSFTSAGSINSLSQELRLSGRLLDNSLNWLAGLNFANDRTIENDLGTLAQSTPAFAFTPAGLNTFSSLGEYADSDAKTKAAFGNVEYKVLPDLSIHGGVRYTQSDIDYKGCMYNTDQNFADGIELVQAGVKGPANVIPIALGQCLTLNSHFDPALVVNSLDQNNVSWRVGADWHFTADSLLYVSASKGYKAGSFPVLPGTGAVQYNPATQESVLAYEIGYKGELFDHTLAIDSAYFHYDYRDKQLLARILDPSGVFGVIDALVNVPKSAEDGVELSANWRPVSALSISAAGTYLDARVTGQFDTYDPYSGKIANFDGYAFPATPRWIGTLGARYDWSVGSNLTAFVGADYRYQTSTVGAFVSTSDYAPGYQYYPGYSPGSLAIASYGLLNARAGIESADRRWKLMLFGNNVMNKYYWTQAYHVYDTTVRYPGMPATYGVTIDYRFSGK